MAEKPPVKEKRVAPANKPVKATAVPAPKKPVLHEKRQHDVAYPEHEKITAIKEQSQAIGTFLEWLGNQGLELCRYNMAEDQYLPDYMGIEKRLSQFFDVDLNRLEEEKKIMLLRQRVANKAG